MRALAFFVAKYVGYRPAQWIAARCATMRSLIPDFAVQVFNSTHVKRSALGSFNALPVVML